MSADDVASEIAQGLNGGSARMGTSDALAALVKELLPAASNDSHDGTAELVAEMARLRTVGERGSEAVSANTDAVALNTSTRNVGGESVLATVGKTAGNILTSGFGLAPLIGGLIGLFGGGEEPQQVALPEYEMPAPIRFETSYGLSAMEEQARAYPGTDVNRTRTMASSPDLMQVGGGQAPAQITIQVQALDSRSFLDHSEDIARAVRMAMLNSNSLNDVVNEL